jgi:hypothetical protein
MLVWILVIILLLALFGGWGYHSGYYGVGTTPYGWGGWGFGTILIVILLILALSGRL